MRKLINKFIFSFFVLLTVVFYSVSFFVSQSLLSEDKQNAATSFLFQTTKQDRFYRAMQNIDNLIEGSDEYKNYLRASIFNETANANIGDDTIIEYLALSLRNRANVGISQIGPSGTTEGFVDRWLDKYGYTFTDLLQNDELNILAKDAFVVERQIGEIPENYNYVKEKFGLECALNPRKCGEIWLDKEALGVITQNPGSTSPDAIADHQLRIYNLTCNQAGSRKTDFSNHTILNYMLIGERSICNHDKIFTNLDLEGVWYVS